MTNPTGFAPADLAAMNTASQQSLGGATAGVTGQGALQGARTRNTAGITEALDSAARGAQETGSQNALGIQGANAMLKEQQKQEGAAGEAGLFGQDLGQQTSLLGQQAGNLGGRAAGGSWMQSEFQPFMNSLFPGPGK
jgi:hypothetical protein